MADNIVAAGRGDGGKKIRILDFNAFSNKYLWGN